MVEESSASAHRCIDNQSFITMSLKLTYFADNKGRNELTRLIFAVGGIAYKDDLVTYSQYTAMRDAELLPWGQLPTLTICSSKDSENKDDTAVVVGQSCSIARYAARRAGLYPKDDINALRSDEVIDSWRDYLDLFYDCYFERKVLGGRMMMVPRQPYDRALRFQILMNTELTLQLDRYETLLSKNDGQLCASSEVPFPCWADLAIYDIVKTMEGVLSPTAFGELMETKPNMKKLVAKTEDLRPIQEHLKKHPYANNSSYFVPVSLLQRMLHAILFPIIEFALSFKSRYLILMQAKSKGV